MRVGMGVRVKLGFKVMGVGPWLVGTGMGMGIGMTEMGVGDRSGYRDTIYYLRLQILFSRIYPRLQSAQLFGAVQLVQNGILSHDAESVQYNIYIYIHNVDTYN